MQITNNYYELNADPMSDEDWATLMDECLAEQRQIVAAAEQDEHDETCSTTQKIEEQIDLMFHYMQVIDAEISSLAQNIGVLLRGQLESE